MLKDKPPNYFEGMLQLREIDQEVLDYVEAALEKSERGGVAKVVEHKNGFDFYFQNNPFLMQIGKQLKARFVGELTTTASLHTRKNNKDLYRVTVLFRAYPFKKGDTIEAGGELYEITGIGKKVLCKRRKDQKKMQLSFDELKKAKVKVV